LPARILKVSVSDPYRAIGQKSVSTFSKTIPFHSEEVIINILIEKYHLKRTNKWIVQYCYANEILGGFADFDTEQLADHFIKVNKLISEKESISIP